jgi:hypothetical protein
VLSPCCKDKGEEWKANPDVAKALQVDLKSDGVHFSLQKWHVLVFLQPASEIGGIYGANLECFSGHSTNTKPEDLNPFFSVKLAIFYMMG